MYSVAVSTPKDTYKIKEEYQPQISQINDINNGKMYNNKRLVVAIKHEQNVKQKWVILEELEKNQLEGGHLLVIFSYASPCETVQS